MRANQTGLHGHATDARLDLEPKALRPARHRGDGADVAPGCPAEEAPARPPAYGRSSPRFPEGWHGGRSRTSERTTTGACRPEYDFCFIDGAHNWTVDGLSFFLVDKLLEKDGWILFDDLGWSYARASAASRKRVEECGILVDDMDEDERSKPHVGLVSELLVQQHPSPDYS